MVNINSIKSYEQLKKIVLNKAYVGLEENVLPKVQKKMVGFINQNVYSVYHPKKYIRRKDEGDSGSLANPENIKSGAKDLDSGGLQYIIHNNTEGMYSDVFLTPLVEMGNVWAINSGYHLTYIFGSYADGGSYIDAYEKPRPFIQPTKEWLKSTKKTHTKNMKAYMNR